MKKKIIKLSVGKKFIISFLLSTDIYGIRQGGALNWPLALLQVDFT